MLIKRIIVSLTMLLVLLTPITVLAGASVPGGVGGGGSGGGGGEPDPHPPYSTYTPKVTAVHNVNGILQQNGDIVYYVPTSKDLPFDIKEYVQTYKVAGTDSENKPTLNNNSFALVYDGYYDSEASTSTPVVDATSTDATIATTVPSLNLGYSYPILNTLGYDLLLKREEYAIVKTTGKSADGKETIPQLEMSVKNELANDSALTAEEAIMDIYKASHTFEYYVQLAFIHEDAWDTNSSPILSELSVLTSQSGTKGLDVSESYTAMAVSRTHPDLYWNRFVNEGILAAVDPDTIGNCSQMLSAGVSCKQTDKITYIQFLRILTAIMNLYGEDSISDADITRAQSAYASSMPSVKTLNEIDQRVVYYLLAKGILDPKVLPNVRFDGEVTLLSNGTTPSNSIIDILSRVENPDIRIKLPEEISGVDDVLSQKGYGLCDLTIASNIANYSVRDYDYSNYYDFLIEKSDVTEWKSKFNSGIEAGDTDYIDVTNIKIFYVDANGENHDIDTHSEIDSTVEREDTERAFYRGVEIYKNKEFYHFAVDKAVLKDAVKVGIGYKKVDLIEPADDNKGDYILDDAEGGVYYTSKEYKHLHFDEAGFDNTFIDSNSDILDFSELSDRYRVVTFYVKSEMLSEGNLRKFQDADKTLLWGRILDSGGKPVVNKAIQIDKDNSNVKLYIQEAATDVEWYRFQIYTSDVLKITNSSLFRDGGVEDSHTSTAGYLKAEDGTLLVSVEYLKENTDEVKSFTPMDNDRYLLTTKEFNNNVILDAKNKYIVVGDTIFKTDSDVMVYGSKGDYYIDYRACMGWTKDFAMIPADKDVSGTNAIVVNVTCNANVMYKHTNETISVNTLFDNKSTISTLYSNIALGQTVTNGVSLSGTYALAPYSIVMTTDMEDYLFVWHRNNLKTSDGQEVITMSEDDDKAAREKFVELTGIQIKKQNDYMLRMYALKKDTDDCGVKHLKYVHETMSTKSGEYVATSGWVWEPPEYVNDTGNGLVDALDAYAKAAISDSEVTLPIVKLKIGNREIYYDVNVNVCGKSGDYQPLGVMPYYLGSKSDLKKKQWTKITSTGYTTLVDTDPEEDTSSYELYPAPAGVFGFVKKLPTKAMTKTESGTFYLGTIPCTVKDKKIVINGHKTNIDAKQVPICTYQGNGKSTVFVLSVDAAQIGEILELVDTKIEATLQNPQNLVDWGQYKFERLVQNMDAWSTVVIIFALNILPRVCMLAFFVLMILSLISDVKPWQLFCRRWFDIYSFLTLGHLTVDTVDMKRTVITSIVCFSLFYVILDGHLFNFIIFIAKSLVYLYQH